MARYKSFEGCWSCRKRKVKCDQAVPTCNRCARASIDCEGYGIRLTWEDEDVAETRRPIGFVKFPNSMLYATHEELDEALVRIDLARPNRKTMIEGPFATFSASITDNSPKAKSLKTMPSNITRPSYPKWLHNPSKGDFIPLPYFFNRALPTNYFESCEQKHDNILFQVDFSDYLPYFPVEKPRQLPQLSPLTQYLLSVYHEYMMPYMSFLVHPQNSWRTSQTPRAVSAIGDVLSTGHSSCGRLCILYSITASTAYFIRDRCSPNSEGIRYYNNLGQKLHTAAKCSIKGSLEGCHAGKYKDLLVALQCLQRTDYFAEYDHSIPWKFFDVIGLLIGSRLQQRPKVSAKAATLHRTSAMSMILSRLSGSLMLSINECDQFYIDESTYSWIDHIFSGMLPDKSDMARKSIETRNTRLNPSFSLTSLPEFEEYLMQYVIEEPFFVEKDEDMYEAELKGNSWELTYGIPCSLGFLFKEAIMLSRGTRDGQGILTQQGLEVQHSEKCINFEAALENWYHQYTPPMILAPVEEETDAGRKGVCLALVNHHTLAFQEALVVYHYRVTKNIDRSILQPRIKRILSHLEAINELTQTRNAPLVCPPCFAGFIGACEAIFSDTDLTRRYDLWFQNLSSTSPFRYGDKLEVINEVRRRQASGLPSYWWSIAREKGIKLNFY